VIVTIRKLCAVDHAGRGVTEFLDIGRHDVSSGVARELVARGLATNEGEDPNAPADHCTRPLTRSEDPRRAGTNRSASRFPHVRTEF